MTAQNVDQQAPVKNEIINPEILGPPLGFSHGVKAGNTVYLGGQTALDANREIIPGGIIEQFRQAFGNILETLREAGGQPEDLVTVTIYLLDVDEYQAHGREIGKIWREMTGGHYPAITGLGVSRLWQKEALIEIDAVAVIQDR